MAQVGTMMKDYFKKVGLSQVEVASRLNVSKAYVNGLLSGSNKIGKATADKLSTVFGFSKAWLLTGEGEMLHSEHPPHKEVATQESDNTNKDINTNNMESQNISELIAHCTSVLNSAASTLHSATELMKQLKQDQADTKKLYEEMHKLQQVHFEKSKVWLEGQRLNIEMLRNDIRNMIDAQTKETERAAKENMEEIITQCKTVKLPTAI